MAGHSLLPALPSLGMVGSHLDSLWHPMLPAGTRIPWAAQWAPPQRDPRGGCCCLALPLPCSTLPKASRLQGHRKDTGAARLSLCSREGCEGWQGSLRERGCSCKRSGGQARFQKCMSFPRAIPAAALTKPWHPWAWLPRLGSLCSSRLHFPVLGSVGHCRQQS